LNVPPIGSVELCRIDVTLITASSLETPFKVIPVGVFLPVLPTKRSCSEPAELKKVTNQV
jgi:hypothetical protein